MCGNRQPLKGKNTEGGGTALGLCLGTTASQMHKEPTGFMSLSFSFFSWKMETMNFHLTGLLGGFSVRIAVKHLAQSLPHSKCCCLTEKQKGLCKGQMCQRRTSRHGQWEQQPGTTAE